MTVDEIWEITKIDKWFLEKLQNIVNCGRDVERVGDIDQLANEHRELLRYSKQVGFSDKQIAGRVGENDITVRDHRKRAGITPIVKQIDTLAAEFPAVTNYLFMTYVVMFDLTYHIHTLEYHSKYSTQNKHTGTMPRPTISSSTNTVLL